MSGPFRALVVESSADKFTMGLQQLEHSALPAGDVLVKVAYSTVNYKDALVCTPRGGVARSSPLIPGIELVGVVAESADPEFAPGDRVLVTDFGNTMGVARHGGFAEYARVPSDFLFRLPADLHFKQTLVLTAGLAVAQGLRLLERQGLTPDHGPVLVTGATGGTGSLAVKLLTLRGYTVAASTGKADAHDYLKQLGASEILSRQETSAESTRPLEKERWAGSIDTVGGATLGYLLRTTQRGGGIAAIGVSGGAEVRATVFPWILRGISVLGVDLPSTTRALRRALWAEVEREIGLRALVSAMTSEVGLEDIPRVTKALLAGQTRGRTLIRIGDESSAAQST